MAYYSAPKFGNNGTRHYLSTIIIVLLTYLVGQIPLTLLYYKIPNHTTDVMGDLMTSYGKNVTFALAILPLALVFFAILLCIKYLHKWTITSIFTSRQTVDFKRIFVGFGIWGLLITLQFIFSINELVEWQFDVKQFSILLLISLVLFPLQCAAEELFFRGILFKWLATQRRTVTTGVLVTGIIFGLAHSLNPEVTAIGLQVMIFYIGTGIFLGFIAHFDDGLELNIGFHVANNLFAGIIVTNTWQAFQTDALFVDHNKPEFGISTMLFYFLAEAIFFLICYKIYNWGNLRERPR